MNLYEILGVATDADQSAIRAAYRRKASLHHPDRSGGNLHEMQKVQEAYDILSDPDRAAIYAETGSTQRESPVEVKAAGMLASLLNKVIDEMLTAQKEPRHTHVADLVRGHLNAFLKEGTECQQLTARRITARRSANARFHFVGSGADYVAAAIDSQVTELEESMRSTEAALNVVRAALTLLAGYAYMCDERESNVPAWSASPTSTSFWKTGR